MIDYYCTCPYWEDTENPCKHIAAVLFAVEELLDKQEEDSSGEVHRLIGDYRSQAKLSAREQPAQVLIVPELETDKFLRVSLKIGDKKSTR